MLQAVVVITGCDVKVSIGVEYWKDGPSGHLREILGAARLIRTGLVRCSGEARLSDPCVRRKC
jgi:hypothetical protein